MKRILLVSCVAFLCVVSFFGGRLSSQKNVADSPGLQTNKIQTYVSRGRTLAFPVDQPTYGLPIAEYSGVLQLLRDGEHTRALSILESALDIVLFDAKQRITSTDLGMTQSLQSAISHVAEYRAKFPRARVDTGSAEINEMQEEVDQFLSEYENPKVETGGDQ